MKTSLLVLMSIFSIGQWVIAQDITDEPQKTFKERFEEGNILMDDKYYIQALPYWEELLKEDPDNANLQYKLGLCYFHSYTDKVEGIRYLEQAIGNINKNYDPFSYLEKGAPVDAYYYLGRLYHLNYQFDKAISTFSLFDEQAGKRHYLYKESLHQIEIANNAKELTSAPLSNIRITNLGDSINTKYPEYSPVISLDESTLYFTSRRLRKDSSNIYYKDIADGMYFEDIYVSYKNNRNQWGEPELLRISRPSNHEATVGLSPDGQTLFIYMDNGGDGGIYQSFLVGDNWTTPEPMGSNINTPAYETHLTMAADGKTLYFTSDRDGGYGGLDIYRCVKLPNGEWSLAQNLGPQINTEYDEDAPYIHANGTTLFFSSKGHKTMGGYDIFFSEKQEDGSWSPAMNRGYPINTADDDVFYITSPDGMRSYKSSFQKDGFGEKDIYLIEIKSEKQIPVTLLKGRFIYEKGKPIPDVRIVVTDNETGEFAGESRPLRRNGSFVFIIPSGKNYNFSYEVDGTECFNENIYIPAGSEYNEISKEIFLSPAGCNLDTTSVVVVANPPDTTPVNNITPKDTTVTAKAAPRWLMRYVKLDKDLPKGLQIMYLDPDGNILFEEELDEKGYFAYHKLPKDQAYLFRLADEDAIANCEDLEIILIDENGENVDFTMVPDEKCIYRKKGTSVVPPGPEISFVQYFGYNAKDIDIQRSDYQEFLNNIKAILEKRGKCEVRIESSASRVPTKTFGSNEKLTKLRANTAKSLLYSDLKGMGSDTENLRVIDMTTLVQGPRYKGDFDTNKEAYGKFQYVKIYAR